MGGYKMDTNGKKDISRTEVFSGFSAINIKYFTNKPVHTQTPTKQISV